MSRLKHINHVLVAKTHPPIYRMHKFWARKPHNVVSEYIKAYSKEGEIILDPFCGSGVTAIETIKLNRKAIAVDINPIVTFITAMTASRVSAQAFKEVFRSIEKRAKEKINEMYLSRCPFCGQKLQPEE